MSSAQSSLRYVHEVGECSTLREYVNEATHGPCRKCGGGEETHTPENRLPFRLRPELGGVDAVVALGFGMPLRWASAASDRESR